jgi:hypothetical protein
MIRTNSLVAMASVNPDDNVGDVADIENILRHHEERFGKLISEVSALVYKKKGGTFSLPSRHRSVYDNRVVIVPWKDHRWRWSTEATAIAQELRHPKWHKYAAVFYEQLEKMCLEIVTHLEKHVKFGHLRMKLDETPLTNRMLCLLDWLDTWRRAMGYCIEDKPCPQFHLDWTRDMASLVEFSNNKVPEYTLGRLHWLLTRGNEELPAPRDRYRFMVKDTHRLTNEIDRKYLSDFTSISRRLSREWGWFIAYVNATTDFRLHLSERIMAHYTNFLEAELRIWPKPEITESVIGDSIDLDCMTEAASLDEPTCSICFSEFGPKYSDTNGTEPPAKISCGHYLGEICLKKWIQDGYATCPFCRQSILPIPSIIDLLPVMVRNWWLKAWMLSEELSAYDQLVDKFLLEGFTMCHEPEFFTVMEKMEAFAMQWNKAESQTIDYYEYFMDMWYGSDNGDDSDHSDGSDDEGGSGNDDSDGEDGSE